MLTMEAMALIIMLSSMLTFLGYRIQMKFKSLRLRESLLLEFCYLCVNYYFYWIVSDIYCDPLVSASMRTSDSVLERFNLTNKNSFSVSDNDIWLRDKSDDSIDMVIKASQMNSTATVFYDLVFFEFYGQEKLNRKNKGFKGNFK